MQEEAPISHDFFMHDIGDGIWYEKGELNGKKAELVALLADKVTSEDNNKT